MKRTSCLNCNVPFEAGRPDQMFCSDKCGSAYWKAHGTTHTHKDLPHFNCKDCEQCGNQFWYNDYAERSGKRVPKFCSTRCRVRYHRAQQNASGPERRERQYTHSQAKAEPRPFKTGDYRDSLRVPSHWTASAAFTWLGCSFGASKEEASKWWRELNKRYHPDMNAGKEWPHLKTVNAAFDYLKRHHWN